jgi:hypothetical protein
MFLPRKSLHTKDNMARAPICSEFAQSREQTVEQMLSNIYRRRMRAPENSSRLLQKLPLARNLLSDFALLGAESERRRYMWHHKQSVVSSI